MASSYEKHGTLESGNALTEVKFVNNIDFYNGLGTVSFLRDIGKHFRVNAMLSRDSVKSRMQGTDANSIDGISFTEFSYQVLQANDFYQLYQTEDCFCQVGGSDQWGNIVSGTDFIRRKTGKEAFGVTIPLLVNAAGEKFGKSTGGGCLWLDSSKTSPYQLYQYLLNVQDSEVEDLLLRLTFLQTALIAETMTKHYEAPQKRLGQTLLASTVIEMVHGSQALQSCQGSTSAFFSADMDAITCMDESEFLSHFADTKKVEITPTVNDLGTTAVMTYSNLIVQSGLRKTRGDAKRVI